MIFSLNFCLIKSSPPTSSHLTSGMEENPSLLNEGCTILAASCINNRKYLRNKTFFKTCNNNGLVLNKSRGPQNQTF